MAVPKKKTCASSTKRQRHSYKIKAQKKIEGMVMSAQRAEKGQAIYAAEKAEANTSSSNITVVQA